MQEIIHFFCKHFILSLMWLILLSMVIVSIIENYFTKVNNITSNEAIYLINKKDALVIDLRSFDDYREGHIINSFNLVAEDIQSGNLGELKKVKNKLVIVISTSSISLRKLSQNLINAGFEKVYVLKEGISGWIAENLPLIQSK